MGRTSRLTNSLVLYKGQSFPCERADTVSADAVDSGHILLRVSVVYFAHTR